MVPAHDTMIGDPVALSRVGTSIALRERERNHGSLHSHGRRMGPHGHGMGAHWAPDGRRRGASRASGWCPHRGHVEYGIG